MTVPWTAGWWQLESPAEPALPGCVLGRAGRGQGQAAGIDRLAPVRRTRWAQWGRGIPGYLVAGEVDG